MGDKPEHLDQDKRYFIFCNECATELLDENSSIYLAMFGPQGLTDEDACLVCARWETRLVTFVPTTPFACDSCHVLVAVSESSGWFIQSHRAERV